MGKSKIDHDQLNNSSIGMNKKSPNFINTEKVTANELVYSEQSSNEITNSNIRLNHSQNNTIKTPASKNTSTHHHSNSHTPKRSNQLEYIQRVILRSLWKHPKSWPFREPVDPIRDNAKDYLEVVKNPMDLGTIRSKLLNGQYEDANDCINDFRLIFQNCYTYNSEGLVIRSMCETLEEFFNEKLALMPPLTTNGEIDKDTISNGISKSGKTKQRETTTSNTPNNSTNVKTTSQSKKRTKEVALRTPPKKKKTLDESDQSTVVVKTTNSSITNESLNKEDSTTASRRDSRKLSLRTSGSKTLNTSTSNNSIASLNYVSQSATMTSTNSSQALKYCLTMVKELFTKKHADYAWPFYDPVDPNVLQIGDYNDIIHFPVDLSTIRKRLELNKYSTAFECVTELRRMITNSFRYNPEGHIVNQAGQKLLVSIEMLIARAPSEVYDFLIVVPTSVIIPHVDSMPNVLANNTLLNNRTKNVMYDDITNGVNLSNKKKSLSSTNISRLKKDDFYGSDNDSFDDDYVNPLISKAHHGVGYTNVETNHAEPMTYEEKRKLSLEINRMPTDKLGEIIAFLSDMESDIFKEKNKSEVEIDFDSMKPETLRSLEKYVKYLNKPQKSRKKKLSATSNNINSKNSTTSITNISNPLTSTIKKFSLSSSNNIDNSYKSSMECGSTATTADCNNSQFISTLPLSEESDYSDKDDNFSSKKLSNNNTSMNFPSNFTHTNISISKQSSSTTYTNSNTINSTTTNSTNISRYTKNSTLTFDTVDDSMIPSSMLTSTKKQDKSPTDLINEAKAAVKQQKMVNSISNAMPPPPPQPPSSIISSQSIPNNIHYNTTNNNNSPSTNINKQTTSFMTAKSGIPLVIDTPEIRDDSNTPKAPTTLEEREKMKQEERQRRLALASGSHSNISNNSNDIVSSFENKL